MANEDDVFFRQRLAHLRQSRGLLESTRNQLKQQTEEAGGYFGRLCLQLKHDQQLVKSLQDMSSNLLLRIASGIDIFQGSSEITDIIKAELRSESSASSASAPAKCSVFDASPVLSSRPVGKSDFMRGIGQSSATIS